ncbi:hypothetical protein FV139_07140 [Parahaliea maris]|uniref:Uncharacterized protein n=1 Tax=Parahaliea maris TaxID=2716870 RepID=A0A5C9A8U0_9GAMM|nr:hypothetical protein [Parahaliea maris]TXS95641.1 hypothetical protein FV139_07140 [Parahaliea maris]
MILDSYQDDHRFFNTNFFAPTGDGQYQAYRGDLVITDGGLDDKGHPNPPEDTLRGSVILANDKIRMLIGSLDEVDLFPKLLARFQADFADDIVIMLFAVNARESARIQVGSVEATIIPLVQGVPWNEAIDALALEKSDFKGYAPADKLTIVFREFQSYNARGPLKSMDQLLMDTTQEKRMAWGAV